MRVFFACVFALAVASTSARAAVVDPLETPAPRRTHLENGEYTGIARAGDVLVAVGRRGLVAVSGDDGSSWTQAMVPTAVDLTAVGFSTPQIGWATGHGAVLLRSADGGRTWERCMDGNDLAALLHDAYAARAEAGDADAQRVLPDVEFLTGEPTSNPFLDVWFVSEQEGYIVGAFNLLLVTHDGGEHWEPWLERTENPEGSHLYGVRSDGDEVYIVGERGLVMRLDRAANRFVALPSPYAGSYFGVVAQPGRLVAYGLRGNAYASRDSGGSWQRLDTRGSDSITGAFAFDSGAIGLVTQAGALLTVAAGDERIEREQTPLPQLTQAARTADGRVVLVGLAGIERRSLPEN